MMLFIKKENSSALKGFATVVAALDFVISIPLWFLYKTDGAEFQFATQFEWIPSVGVQYLFGVDGFAVLLILLTTLLGLIAIYSSFTAIAERQKEYYIFLLLLQTGMLGVFCSLDFVLFYVFWEVMLVPMYFLIGVWGGPRQPLRRHQVLPLHPGRFGADAGRYPDALFLQLDRSRGDWPAGPRECRHLLHPAPLHHRAPDPCRGAILGLSRFLRRLCHQGADVPVPHLVARCPRRGPDRGLGDPGRRPPENGNLRLHPVLAAHPAGRDGQGSWAGSGRWRSSRSSTAPWWPWCRRT